MLMLIIALQIVFFFVDFEVESESEFSQKEIKVFQREFDSLQKVVSENKKPKLYPFNPNFITDYKGYQLGMTVEQINKLFAYRKQGKYVNTSLQFQQITGVADSLLNVISPYFKFPEWVNSKKKKSTTTKITYVDKNILKTDINLATKTDFMAVKGVGEKLASRIVKYRTKLQGFSTNSQLHEVWYLDQEVANTILQYFEVIELPLIKKININEASFKELLSVVYIDYELTKKILNYRDEVAEIQSIDELKKIEGFPLDKFDRITLYLDAN